MKTALAILFGVLTSTANANPLFAVSYTYPQECRLSTFFGIEIDRTRNGGSVLGYNVFQDGKVLQKYRGSRGDGSNMSTRGSKYGHIRFGLETSKELKDGNEVLTITAGKRHDPYKPFDLMGSLYDVKDFPAEEAVEYLSNSVRLDCLMEETSKFSPENVRGNFIRLVGQFDSSVIYKTRSRISTVNLYPEWKGLQTPDSFVMLIDDTPVLLYPQFVPYRNGTKVLLRAVLPANPKQLGNVDFTAQVRALKDHIVQVVNN